MDRSNKNQSFNQSDKKTIEGWIMRVLIRKSINQSIFGEHENSKTDLGIEKDKVQLHHDKHHKEHRIQAHNRVEAARVLHKHPQLQTCVDHRPDRESQRAHFQVKTRTVQIRHRHRRTTPSRFRSSADIPKFRRQDIVMVIIGRWSHGCGAIAARYPKRNLALSVVVAKIVTERAGSRRHRRRPGLFADHGSGIFPFLAVDGYGGEAAFLPVEKSERGHEKEDADEEEHRVKVLQSVWRQLIILS